MTNAPSKREQAERKDLKALRARPARMVRQKRVQHVAQDTRLTAIINRPVPAAERRFSADQMMDMGKWARSFRVPEFTSLAGAR